MSEKQPDHKPDTFMGRFTIMKPDGPYMTQRWCGRAFLHVFHRGDEEDPHDHPSAFWTFPLVPYIERVYVPHEAAPLAAKIGTSEFTVFERVVPAFRLHRREWWHIHRVIGRADGRDGPIVTLVWRERERRGAPWGFWVRNVREDRSLVGGPIIKSFLPWQDYLYLKRQGPRPDEFLAKWGER